MLDKPNLTVGEDLEAQQTEVSALRSVRQELSTLRASLVQVETTSVIFTSLSEHDWRVRC